MLFIYFSPIANYFFSQPHLSVILRQAQKPDFPLLGKGGDECIHGDFNYSDNLLIFKVNT